MPQPHEQKLQEVVNSLTSASFNSLVAAFTSRHVEDAAERETDAATERGLHHSLRLTSVALIHEGPPFHVVRRTNGTGSRVANRRARSG